MRPELYRETRTRSPNHVQTDGGEPSLDTVFQILSNRRRRFVLYFLTEVDDPIGREELARRIATWERDEDIGDVPSDEIARVTVSLDHAHLPRLEDGGVVSYDREEREIAATDAVDRFLPYLDLARPEDFD
jgi:DNA-binding transcriptional ArsR family regulator